jgi:hypothetical protein
LKISKPFTEKKSHGPRWDENQPSTDPWEDQMRQDSVVKIVFGGKTKKVRGGPSRKKLTQHTPVRDLIQIAIDKGRSTIKFEIDGYEVVARRVPLAGNFSRRLKDAYRGDDPQFDLPEYR